MLFLSSEKGHKKAREEEMRAIKSKVMSLPSTPANPTLVSLVLSLHFPQ